MTNLDVVSLMDAVKKVLLQNGGTPQVARQAGISVLAEMIQRKSEISKRHWASIFNN